MNKLPDFNRHVYCLLGLPFDSIGLVDTAKFIQDATTSRVPCFLSTPNLNFLIASRTDSQFRDSVIHSDLSIADGMPLVWVARLLGVPINERVAGSDLFEVLKSEGKKRISVYFFGGMPGVAELACQRINGETSNLSCAGYESPGFAEVQEMSKMESINKINASGADFLIVSLGAKKGQAWIEYNFEKIKTPVISHLGAVVNFVAGNLKRAPVWIRRFGIEWLWRIKEEPTLWRRYIFDGFTFLVLLSTRVFPYFCYLYKNKLIAATDYPAVIEMEVVDLNAVIKLAGSWNKRNLQPLRDCLTSTVQKSVNISIEMGKVTYIDSAFIGLMLLLYGSQKRQGKYLILSNPSKNIRKTFWFLCAEFLLQI